MIYGLVEDGDTFQKGDEVLTTMQMRWDPVPAQWYGMTLKRDDRGTTFARFKMQVRRPLPAQASEVEAVALRCGDCIYTVASSGESLYCSQCRRAYPDRYKDGAPKTSSKVENAPESDGLTATDEGARAHPSTDKAHEPTGDVVGKVRMESDCPGRTRIEWGSVDGINHKGLIKEWDSNVAVVDCETCGKECCVEL